MQFSLSGTKIPLALSYSAAITNPISNATPMGHQMRTFFLIENWMNRRSHAPAGYHVSETIDGETLDRVVGRMFDHEDFYPETVVKLVIDPKAAPSVRSEDVTAEAKIIAEQNFWKEYDGGRVPENVAAFLGWDADEIEAGYNANARSEAAHRRSLSDTRLYL